MIINVNCLDWMKTQPDNSIGCIVTDPPYGLKFMSKKWDYELPSIEIWQELLRISKPGTWLLAFGGSRTYHRLTCSIEDAGWEIRDCIMWMHGQGFPKGKGCLKPSYEPIILARKRAPKPELNIDECRIGSHNYTQKEWTEKGLSRVTGNSFGDHKPSNSELPNGRWPANIILDEISAELLDQQTGISKSSGHIRHNKMPKCETLGKFGSANLKGIEDSGGASRFFYCAKASSSERNRGCVNGHPTVKPLKLMEYLINLVAPKDGVILDPFAGSGTTIVAAKKIGYNAIGIELDPEYCKIAEARIAAQECQTEIAL